MKNPTTTFQHPFLAGMDARHLQTLLHGAKEQQFDSGEIIFREGEPANTLYLIESGRVALETTSPGGGTTLIQTVGTGDLLGWSWLFPPFAWQFKARATQPTRAICCDGGHILVHAEEDPVFGYHVMRRISQLVIKRLQATRKQLVKKQSPSRPPVAAATAH